MGVVDSAEYYEINLIQSYCWAAKGNDPHSAHTFPTLWDYLHFARMNIWADSLWIIRRENQNSEWTSDSSDLICLWQTAAPHANRVIGCDNIIALARRRWLSHTHTNTNTNYATLLDRFFFSVEQPANGPSMDMRLRNENIFIGVDNLLLCHVHAFL